MSKGDTSMIQQQKESPLATLFAAAPELGDWRSWRIERLAGGAVCDHIYKITRESDELVLKQIRENERYTLELLDRTGCEIAPRIVSPEALRYGVLVTDFIPGGRWSSLSLPAKLIVQFAMMQNRLNDRELFDSPTPSLCRYIDRDDNFYGPGLLQNMGLAGERIELFVRSGHPSAAQTARIFQSFRDELPAIAADFAGMPFAWHHNDFEPRNLIGEQPKLIDWGSSFGHAPYFYDLAPYLMRDHEGDRLYRSTLDHCACVDDRSYERWRYVATVARFVSWAVNRIREDGGTRYLRDSDNDPIEPAVQLYSALLD